MYVFEHSYCYSKTINMGFASQQMYKGKNMYPYKKCKNKKLVLVNIVWMHLYNKSFKPTIIFGKFMENGSSMRINPNDNTREKNTKKRICSRMKILCRHGGSWFYQQDATTTNKINIWNFLIDVINICGVNKY